MKQIVSKRTRGFLQALIGTLAVTPDATFVHLRDLRDENTEEDIVKIDPLVSILGQRWAEADARGRRPRPRRGPQSRMLSRASGSVHLLDARTQPALVEQRLGRARYERGEREVPVEEGLGVGRGEVERPLLEHDREALPVA